MDTDLYRDLQWLPRPPDDWSKKVRELQIDSDDFVRDLMALAQYALDLNQLSRLAKVVARARESGRKCTPLVPFRLGLVGHGTLDLIAPALVGTCLRHGFLLEVLTGGYDQLLQSVAGADSPFIANKPDVVLVSLDWRSLPLICNPGDADQAQQVVGQVMELINQTLEGIRGNIGVSAIVPTLSAPAESIFGNFERSLPGSRRWLLDAINQKICERVYCGTETLLDVAAMAETVGLGHWHDNHQWNLAKLPFGEAYIPLYADHVGRTLAALRGRSRRVLVLDLDNTVWGGVIGDDGMAGIVLAQGDAAGEAYLSVQRMALELRNRGVVLAVCSKNTDEVAREVFRSHPEMLIREKHISVFQANWKDKATNLRSIAAELNLGIDSLVFLDDNPVERGLVRQELPQIAVPEIGSDPADYARTLAAGGYFDLVGFSEEDRKRAEFYDMNAKRAAMRVESGNLDSYLDSLQMELALAPFDAVGRGRIEQLINKSNQFNLTTRRYSATDVEKMQSDPGCYTLQIRLKDIYGDNGMISVVVCRAVDAVTWEIDTWLMSCRVLGRKVEQAVLGELLSAARASGVQKIVGRYIPTERNGLVKDHYRDLGFALADTRSDGETVWVLGAETEVERPPMTIERTGFASPALNS